MFILLKSNKVRELERKVIDLELEVSTLQRKIYQLVEVIDKEERKVEKLVKQLDKKGVRESNEYVVKGYKLTSEEVQLTATGLTKSQTFTAILEEGLGY